MNGISVGGRILNKRSEAIIQTTQNGGLSWDYYIIPKISFFWGVQIPHKDTIYAYGSEGIVKYIKKVSDIQNTSSLNNNFIICHSRELIINEESILISIYNNNGRLISVTNNEAHSLSTIKLSSSAYPNGLYFILIKLKNGSLLRKLIMLL